MKARKPIKNPPPKKESRNLPGSGTARRWQHPVTIITLMLVTFLVYEGAVKNGLLNWDDNYYITESKYLKDLSWQGIRAIFSTYLMGNYHPLPLLSYAIEYQVAGISPKLMHLTNVLFHMMNTVLVFYFVKRLLKNQMAGIIAALFFALHPMHVESVAWIAERKDVMYAFFFLLSLIFYLRYLEDKKGSSLLITFIFFALSLLSKSAAATLAPLLFVLDYFMNRKLSWKSVLEKIPFFALALFFAIVALSSQKTAMDAGFAPQFPFWQRFFIAGRNIGWYMLKFFFPWKQSAMHPYPLEPGEGISGFIAATLVMLILLGSIMILLFRNRKYWRITLSSLLFFIITMAMTLQLIPVGRAIVAERYTYIPYIGLSLPIAFFITESLKRKDQAKDSYHLLPAWVVFGMLCYFGVVTAQRITVWKDSFSLFGDILAKYPGDALIYYNRGLTKYYGKDYQGAVSDYDSCLKYDPTYSTGYFNRGLAYKELGDMPAVWRSMDSALKYKPDYADAFKNRGNARAFMKDYEGSIDDFSQALRLLPNDTAILMNRGLSHYFSGQTDKACDDWKTAAGLGSVQCRKMVLEQCDK